MTARTLHPLLALVATALTLTGCTSGGEAGPATVTVTASPSTETTPAPPPSESPEPSPTTSPTTEPTTPAVVELTASGVGDLAWDTAGAQAALTALLGAPESSEPFPSECGPSDVQTLRWGSVKVFVQADTLMAWEVDRMSTLPATLGVPGDVVPGSPWSAAAALPGATAPTFLDNYQLYQLAVQAPGDPDAVYYVAQSDDADAPVLGVHARMILGCG